MRIMVLSSPYELEDNAKPYYGLFKNVRANILQGPLGCIAFHNISSDEKYLIIFKREAQIAHPRYDEIINKVIQIMKIEKVRRHGKLATWIKILKKASNFDWSNMEEFKKFDKVYVRILKELKKLY